MFSSNLSSFSFYFFFCQKKTRTNSIFPTLREIHMRNISRDGSLWGPMKAMVSPSLLYISLQGLPVLILIFLLCFKYFFQKNVPMKILISSPTLWSKEPNHWNSWLLPSISWNGLIYTIYIFGTPNKIIEDPPLCICPRADLNRSWCVKCHTLPHHPQVDFFSSHKPKSLKQ